MGICEPVGQGSKSNQIVIIIKQPPAIYLTIYWRPLITIVDSAKSQIVNDEHAIQSAGLFKIPIMFVKPVASLKIFMFSGAIFALIQRLIQSACDLSMTFQFTKYSNQTKKGLLISILVNIGLHFKYNTRAYS